MLGYMNGDVWLTRMLRALRHQLLSLSEDCNPQILLSWQAGWLQSWQCWLTRMLRALRHQLLALSEDYYSLKNVNLRDPDPYRYTSQYPFSGRPIFMHRHVGSAK